MDVILFLATVYRMTTEKMNYTSVEYKNTYPDVYVGGFIFGRTVYCMTTEQINYIRKLNIKIHLPMFT